MTTAMERMQAAYERYLKGDDDDVDALMDLADTVGDFLGEEEHDAASPKAVTTTQLGLTWFEAFPVKIDGVTYATAFNAFQSYKAPPAERAAFANLTSYEATERGRKCQIDVKAWDANRKSLITKILTKQASQHTEFKTRILTHCARDDVVHDTMGLDPFWGPTFEQVWKDLYAHFSTTTTTSKRAQGNGKAKASKRAKRGMDDDEEED